MNYPIQNIYMDVYKQGKYTGYPTIFVEFSEDETNIMNEFQIWKKIKSQYQYHLKFCFITVSGVEPTRYYIPPLMNLLCDFSDFQIHLDTNGFRPDYIADTKECNPYICLKADTPLNRNIEQSILFSNEIHLNIDKVENPNTYVSYVLSHIKGIMKPVIYLTSSKSKESLKSFVLKHPQFKMIIGE